MITKEIVTIVDLFVLTVQPDTVSAVRISPNSTCLNVQWEHSDQKSRKVFQVQYKSEWMPTAEVRQCQPTSQI